MQRARQDELVAHYGDPTKMKARRSIRTIRLPLEEMLIGGMITTQCHNSIAAKFVDAYWQNCRFFDEWPTQVQGYNVRKIAGTEKWSLHSWALAWDIKGGRGRLDPATGWRIPSSEWFNGMEKFGFFAGQNFRKPDLHHLEFPFKTW